MYIHRGKNISKLIQGDLWNILRMKFVTTSEHEYKVWNKGCPHATASTYFEFFIANVRFDAHIVEFLWSKHSNKEFR